MELTVLIVDDERFIVELIADILEDEGYVVDRAYDGLQAEETIARSPPDLVIADVMMPRVDGLTLIKHLRQLAAPIPVLLMSAVPRPNDLDVPFLPKPFDIQDLLQAVKSLTSRPVYRTGPPAPAWATRGHRREARRGAA